MTGFDEYGHYGENNPAIGERDHHFTAAQRAQITNARKVVSDMREQGHTDRNIEFALRQEGYAAAAIKAALEGRDAPTTQDR